MSGKKKGNIANPDLHSSESPAKDGNELKNRINETAKYSELFEKIDVAIMTISSQHMRKLSTSAPEPR